MKNIKFLLLALVTLTAFTACQEDWNPGPVDSELSVYLPVDQDIAAFALKDNEETGESMRVAKFPVYRQNTTSAMDVEIRYRFLEPDKVFSYTITDEKTEETTQVDVPIAEAFQISDVVSFAQGEKVGYIMITLSEKLVGYLSVGKFYQAEIMIKEAKHHGNYGLYRKTINIGIPESWGSANVNYKEGSTEELTNVGYLFDDFIAPAYGMAPGNSAPVVIEQSVSRPGYYRMVNPYSEENVVAFIGGIPGDMSFAAGDHYIDLDARDPENVIIYGTLTGMVISGMGEVMIGTLSGAPGGVLEDGIITFPANCMGIFIGDVYGDYANTSGLYKVVLPGIDISDYAMGVSFLGTEVATDNSATYAIINFAVGADVKEFRFVAVEGNVPAYTVAEDETTIEYHPEILKLIDDEYEPTEDDTMATATPDQTNWTLSFDKAGVYTVFAVPYGKEGEPVMEEIASTFFYYRPSTSVDAVPEIKPLEMTIGSIEDLVVDDPMQPMDYELIYNSTYVLGCDLKLEDYEYVSAMKRYFDKKSAVDELLANGATIESLLEGPDAVDAYDWLEAIIDEGGNTQMVMQQLDPDTEYTMLMSVRDIYGNVNYYSASGKTKKYDGDLEIGIYEFVDGDSKMQIKVAPFWSTAYAQYYMQGQDDRSGQMYLLSWIGDEVAAEEEGKEPVELHFYTFYMPVYNTLVCYGQAMEDASYGFGMGIDTYIDGTEKEGDPEKKWGYYSSSTEDFEYNTESMVFNLARDGKSIESLVTYFKKYYYYYEEVKETDENGEEVSKDVYREKVLASFAPETTTVTLKESHMPEPDPVVPETPETPEDTETPEDAENTENTENTENPEAKKASVREYKGAMELKFNADLAKKISASVYIK